MSSGRLKIYDSDQVTVIIAGIPISGGYADGEFISIEPASDDFMSVVGTDGEVSRSKSNNKMATATLNLMQTSESNALLSALRVIDLSTPNGGGVGPFLVKDRQGLTKYSASKCWISKPPTASFDQTAKPRAWTITIADLDIFEGGN